MTASLFALSKGAWHRRAKGLVDIVQLLLIFC